MAYSKLYIPKYILCFLVLTISYIYAFNITSEYEIKEKPLVYNGDTIQINAKTLYFKELQKNTPLPKNVTPLKHTKDTQALLQSKEIPQGHTHNRFEGNLEINGILQYSIRTDWNGVHTDWVLFFDEVYYKSKLIPKNKPYPNIEEMLMPESAYMRITKPKEQELQKLFNIAESKPLIIIGVRVNGILKELNITTHDGDEWDFFGNVEIVSLSGDIIFKYPNKRELIESMGLSDNILLYASPDSYINLRQSPNGKILQAIQKDTILNDCNLRGNELNNQGILLSLGKDPTNPKWLKVAYIPKEANDTSKAIYGVIHESQVSFDCEE
ncbi:hypothetical protein [Helicobacter trogontum]|uniref:hypothetical protein n=1 Tax=Helicobacter trogontum TaxID=50960 RepID=UPI00051D1889|nr:hypothetical protein [Helicobacter trogontum]